MVLFLQQFQDLEVILTFPSARAAMTFPRADNDLLMFFASSSTDPSAPVLLTCRDKHQSRLDQFLRTDILFMQMNKNVTILSTVTVM